MRILRIRPVAPPQSLSFLLVNTVLNGRSYCADRGGLKKVRRCLSMRLVEAAKREVGPDGLIGDVSGGTATLGPG